MLYWVELAPSKAQEQPSMCEGKEKKVSRKGGKGKQSYEINLFSI